MRCFRGVWLASLVCGGCYGGLSGNSGGPDGQGSAGPAGAETDGGDTDGGDTDGAETEGDPADECDAATPAAVVRMLNRREFRNTIRDLLEIDEQDANAAIEALPSDAIVGFDNNAESLVASALHVEQHLAIAESLASQVGLSALLDCDPGAPADEATCTSDFVQEFGRRAFRRPTTAGEQAVMTALFDTARADGHSFAEAIRIVLQGFLQSPQFLYRAEASATPDGGEVRADGYALASRLSFFMWSSMPDAELLDAAEEGTLDDRAGVEAHARRLLDDPRARATTASFHRQWLELHKLDQTTKDETLVPGFDDLKSALAGETQAFTDFVFWEGSGEVRQLLVSDEILVNWDVASLYGIGGEFGGVFTPAPATAERFGLLTQGSILAHTANPDRTSPTKRGQFVRQQLLCQEPPPPPEGIPELPDAGPEGQTLREMLDQHTQDPACKGCHLLLDPVGFGLEAYDLVGAFRTDDNGTPIDASGELIQVDGLAETTFEGARELSDRLVESGAVEECVAHQWFRFAMGREPQAEDQCSIDRLAAVMEETDGSMPELLIAVATSHAFSHLSTEES